MQQFVFKHKNNIMWVQLALIIFGFIGNFSLENEMIAQGGFLIAGILGLIPLAFQAIGSLKIKVVSIDVLVR